MTESNTTATARSVFITGGDQGVGYALLRDLVKRGHQVTATTTSSTGAARIRRAGGLPAYPHLDRMGEMRGLLQMARADVVIHAAAAYINEAPHYKADPDVALHALRATDEIVIAAGQAGVKRLILVSFSFLYGDTAGSPASEDAPLSSATPLFQAAAEAETAVLDGGLPGYVLRAGYLYGGSSVALRALAAQLQHGEAMPSGKLPACWLHEDDLASALRHLIVQPFGGAEALASVYNIADDQPASPDDFMEELGTAVGVGTPAKMLAFMQPLRTTPTQRALLATSVQMNTAQIRAMGWQPVYGRRAAGLDRALMEWRAEAAEPDAPAPLPERAIVEL